MPLVQFILIWITPESPRVCLAVPIAMQWLTCRQWLCSKDRTDEAYEILVKVCWSCALAMATGIELT